MNIDEQKDRLVSYLTENGYTIDAIGIYEESWEIILKKDDGHDFDGQFRSKVNEFLFDVDDFSYKDGYIGLIPFCFSDDQMTLQVGDYVLLKSFCALGIYDLKNEMLYSVGELNGATSFDFCGHGSFPAYNLLMVLKLEQPGTGPWELIKFERDVAVEEYLEFATRDELKETLMERGFPIADQIIQYMGDAPFPLEP